MALTISEELSRSFDLATLRHEASTLKAPHQWRRVTDIWRQCDEARIKEQKRFETRYHSRVEMVRQRLVDDAGAKSFDLKPRWAGEDAFDANELTRQAEREVRQAHQQRLAKIDELERTGLKAIVEESMRENNLRGTAREQFGRAVDRRSHIERRGQWSRNRER
ncbi:hypothetical protein [Mesorhizobium sp. J428]|uniref:hypothetical protein n=1 Tax=Mesorhizobium sp. J428 TaxID=2898440 RepID=UPI0021513500|nr:hypothetical protein [Mesorhizobium sp. J428]MCR5858263.1 hypothetical protein [Mesorhizobium sp. J428]